MVVRSHTRHAFTLVELLVVIAIIGVMVGLLLPAVQAAREAARRMSCSNNLKQFSLALHNYHDSLLAFPPGMMNTISNWGEDPSLGPSARGGWFALILPYVEQAALHSQWTASQAAGVTNLAFPGRTTIVSTFMCPSDPGAGKLSGIGNGFAGNYVLSGGGFSWGAQATITDVTGQRPTGMFYPRSRVRMADVIDGTSNTIMASEILLVRDSEGTPGSGCGTTADMRGLYWNYVHMGTLFVTARPPNSPAGDVVSWACRGTRFAPCGTCANSNNIVTPRSLHPGGVNVGMADGSIRFVSQSINTQTFQWLGTKSGGEIIPEF